MTFRRALFLGLCLSSAACGVNNGGNVRLGGACQTDVDCREPYHCRGEGAARSCTIDPPTICFPASTRCEGNTVATCNELGTAWVNAPPACATGCGIVTDAAAPGGRKAACLPQFCAPNSSRCEGPNVVVKCDATGTSEFFYQSCAAGCVADGAQASCGGQRCDPYATRCKSGDPGKLLTCDSRGIREIESDCPAVGSGTSICVAGRCRAQVCTTTTTGSTTTRQQRCSGAVREECNDEGTAWRAVEVCALGCNFDEQTSAAACAQANCKPTPEDEPVGPYASVCDPNDTTRSRLLTCDERGAEWIQTDCAALPTPHVCLAGACVPRACTVQRDGSGNITAREERCNGPQVEECDDTQSGFRPQGSACSFGCGLSAPGDAACLEPECAFNGGGSAAQRACAGNTLQRCNASGVFAFDRFCPSGCIVGASGPECAAPVCQPLSRRCRTDTTGSFVEICKSDGTGRETLERCPQGCGTGTAEGTCAVTDDTCSPGALRCAAESVQRCVALPNGATEWRFIETCIDGCVAGVCNTTAACGCSGSSEPPEVECGSAARAPFGVRVVKADADTDLPCDGLSTFLLVTDVIKSAGGAVVPDGTFVTFSTPGTGLSAAIFSSADADPTQPGLQRPTRNGVARVLIASPDECTEPVAQEVRADIAGACSGAASFTFATPVQVGNDGRPAYHSEDFSTTERRDPINTTAQWNAAEGLVRSAPAFDIGTGRDGDILVGTGPSGSGTVVVDLSEFGHARTVDVTRIGVAEISTSTSLPPFSPGDEALVLLQWSNDANDVGTFEFKTVASVATGRLVFTSPFTKTFSPTPEVSGRRVTVTRVPHFKDVTILGNGQLTTSAPTGTAGANLRGGSGVLAFRASGTVLVQGLIDMKNRGLPANVAQPSNARPNQSLPRLIVGGGGSSTAGGGVVFIAAGRISHLLTTAPPAAPEGTITAHSDNGYGGIVWTGAGELFVGPTARPSGALHVATSGVGGRNGVVRTDYVSTDATTPHWGSPAAFSIQSGGMTVASTVVVEASSDIESVQLVAAFAGTSSNVVVTGPGLQSLPNPDAAPVPLAGATLDFSADNGSTWQEGAEDGEAQNTQGSGRNRLRWRAQLNPVSGRPLELGGLVFRLLRQ